MSDEWERVNTEKATTQRGFVNSGHPNARTHRLKVPGGWLYRVIIKTAVGSGTYGERVCMSFVPEVPDAD
jgi:hypothetical protein